MRVYFGDYQISDHLDKLTRSCPTLEDFLSQCEEYLTGMDLSFDFLRENLIQDYNHITNFWEDKAGFFPSGKSLTGRLFVIKGVCYYRPDRESGEPSSCRGFGGRRFVIRVLSTGETLDTTDLWHNGTIPSRFRDRMPDTAEFVD